jgi:hypothetical protein
MSFNHRVLVIEDGEDYQYCIHEVYYDKEGKPNGYTKRGVEVVAESKDGLNWVLDRMKECLDKKYLWGDDRFPEEFKIK